MKLVRFATCLVLVIPAAALLIVGCSQTATPEAKPEKKPEPVAEKKAHDHSGEWCNEHGVWEKICGQCDAKYSAECKAKGDWCKQHNRPDSQCFVCHPEKEAEFAAEYEAKYGKKPPKPEEETPAKQSKS